MFVLRTLRAHVMVQASLDDICKATLIAQIIYASPAQRCTGRRRKRWLDCIKENCNDHDISLDELLSITQRCSISDVLFTGERRVSDFSVLAIDTEG